MYVNTCFPIFFKFQYNFKDSNVCVTFSDSFIFHGHVKYTIFKDKNIKKVIKQFYAYSYNDS